jgi:hypothetical protein
VSRRSIVVIDDFYAEPDLVRKYALDLSYYTPYESRSAVDAGQARATWWASRFQDADRCPIKSSAAVVSALEHATGERIDTEHWRTSFPVTEESKPVLDPGAPAQTCLWNCSFHVKPDNGQELGGGVHNHVTDQWNSVGSEGWAGIVYLNPDAPVDGGLYLWRNVDESRDFDWMSPAENWQLIDAFGNIYNRLVLVRGDVPHSGAGGWGHRLEEGRLYQTFFFKTVPEHTASVEVPT